MPFIPNITTCSNPAPWLPPSNWCELHLQVATSVSPLNCCRAKTVCQFPRNFLSLKVEKCKIIIPPLALEGNIPVFLSCAVCWPRFSCFSITVFTPRSLCCSEVEVKCRVFWKFPLSKITIPVVYLHFLLDDHWLWNQLGKRNIRSRSCTFLHWSLQQMTMQTLDKCRLGL